jgi:cyanobactin maturation PatA/PatG family protease
MASPERVSRNTYIIDPEGIIQRIDEDVDPQSQAETALAFLREALREREQAAPAVGSATTQHDIRTIPMDVTKGERRMMDEETNELGLESAGEVEAPAEKPEPQHGQAGVPRMMQPAQAGEPSLVFPLGMIGYDFGSEARRDSFMQHMQGNPGDPGQLLAYLDQDPSQAAAITWTLNLDATPIYAIQPGGPFAQVGYERLRQFLREQIEEGVERVSVPGRLVGQAQLMSGQIVPIIWPEPRCMYSWTTAALVEAVCGKPPGDGAAAKEKEAYAQKAVPVANFLERVYHELRNLGMTPQDRAINYAATNAMIAQGIFEAALKENMELDTIEIERSPICRLDSECWDVKLTFFNPRKVFEQARKVYRFTVDVSDVCPVMVSKVRSWSIR